MIDTPFKHVTLDIETRARKALSSYFSTPPATDPSCELYNHRLSWELEYIQKAGLAPYISAVTDLVDYALSVGIMVGPGRGSSLSSLVLFLLGVTRVDPVAYDLIFERWLSDPGIEIEVEWSRRKELVDYIWERYGTEHTAYIGTERRDSTTGRILNRGIHAACYAISSRPIEQIVSTHRADDGRLVTDDARPAIEGRGLGVLTIMGMRELGIIAEVTRLTGNTEIPDEDEATMILFQTGDTGGVFQFSSAAMQKLLIEAQPRNKADLIAVNAVLRPPFFSSGLVHEMVSRVSRGSKPEHSAERKLPEDRLARLPALRDAFSSTYGIMVFQEQFIELIHRLTDWNFMECERFRYRVSQDTNCGDCQNELIAESRRKSRISIREEEDSIRSLIAGSR